MKFSLSPAPQVFEKVSHFDCVFPTLNRVWAFLATLGWLGISLDPFEGPTPGILEGCPPLAPRFVRIVNVLVSGAECHAPFMAERVAKSSLIHEPSFCFGPCIPLPFFARGFTLYDLKAELIGLRNLFVAQ